MIVVCNIESKKRWEDFMFLYEAAEKAGAPLPSEAPYIVPCNDWRERRLHEALAIELDTGQAAVFYEDEYISLKEAISLIQRISI
jgi:hypothetical protein